MSSTSVREAVGVFHDEAALRTAADELMVAGFDRSALSLMASVHAVETRLGHNYEKVAELEDDDDVPRIAYVGVDSRTEAKAALTGGLAYLGAVGSVGAIVASGGTAAAAIAAAAAGAGVFGTVGGLLARFVERRHAHYLQQQLDHGGLLLWVHVDADSEAERAQEIMRRSGADDVHIHDLPAQKLTLQGGESYDLSFMKRLGM